MYPLYPITAAFLRARGGRFAHPAVYYLGMGMMYACFGLIAAITGGAFNDLLRLPTANMGIGVALGLLALATLGYLHFPVFAQPASQERNGLGWTLLMGAGAGMLSSACVGPVVVSVLLAVVTSTSGVTAGMLGSASLKMAAFGFGVGLPVLLIGVFGMGLPRGGRWMLAVQWGFGLLIAYFAMGYLVKGLTGFGLSESATHATLAGALLFGLAIFLLQDSEQYIVTRTKRSLYGLALVSGFFMMTRSLLPGVAGADPGMFAAAQAGGTTQGPLTETQGNLTWHLDKEAAYAEAATRGKPVFVDFHANWCSNCKAFQERALSNAQLNAALQNAVLLKTYDTSPLFEAYKRDGRFPELLIGLPYFIITDASEDVLYKTSDFTRTDEMALFLSD